MRSTRKLSVLVALVMCAVSIVFPTTASGQVQEVGCADSTHPGGDWPVYGGDLSNSRNQTAEDSISPTNASLLSAEWSFSPTDAGGIGSIQSTPVVAEGCVFITTSSGWVYALNADSGVVVWNEDIAETVSEVCCGGTLFAPTVRDGILYINVSSNPQTATDQLGPHVVAMNAHTGQTLWRTEVAGEPGSYTNSSAVFYDDMLWIGISNPEQGYHQIGGFALLDAETGEVIKRTLTIPAEQAEEGFAGGGIWSTAAVDEATGYAYAGTAQPSPWPFPEKESEYTNALIKFDLARARDADGNPVASAQITNPDFGEIVGVRKGDPDQLPYIDVDFGASPTLFEDAFGRTMVAALQKSGWVHAAYTRQMAAAWSTIVAPYGTAIGNYSSTATDGSNVYAVGTFPGQFVSIDGTTGAHNWVSPVGTIAGANPVAYANGVVYHADGKGFLDAVDAATGVPLLHHPMSIDTGYPCMNIGGGVSIARNTVFAVCGERGAEFPFGPDDTPSGWVIAYRIPS